MAAEVDDAPVVILVAEMDAAVRLTTADLLIGEGYRTVEARDASEAMALLDARPSVRLLLVSRRLPGDVDGVGLAHIARRRHPDLRIIVTTGGGGLDPAGLPEGALQMRKPYELSALLRAVERLSRLPERARGAPLTPRGLAMTHTGSGADGVGAVAAPVAEPDKT